MPRPACSEHTGAGLALGALLSRAVELSALGVSRDGVTSQLRKPLRDCVVVEANRPAAAPPHRPIGARRLLLSVAAHHAHRLVSLV
ncbi:hypothetical protein [Oryza sativa Japonica Group]|uniref:Uncharacterized protein n=1 Tax=Oryza sativa subsp. japonica TaxID=39947 RepID=Q5JNG2_ORYSJ|nr:hypothetical protein [Oryza sativa Japonica Group]BAD86996.1 hypothetical protein [Oryza sativa Japonica Group]